MFSRSLHSIPKRVPTVKQFTNSIPTNYYKSIPIPATQFNKNSSTINLTPHSLLFSTNSHDHTTPSTPSSSASSSHSSSAHRIPSPTLSDEELAELHKPIGSLPRNFVVNSPNIPGYEVVNNIGLVTGNTVRVRNVATDWFAGIRAMFGGELVPYTLLMIEAREQATERMVEEAVALGANAIVNVRYTTTNLAANAAEIFVYGTAVVVK